MRAFFDVLWTISNTEKGPCAVQEKLWGSITSESHYERILPLIRYQMNLKTHLISKQEYAPNHKVSGTMREFDRPRIKQIFWSAISPDLNTIKLLEYNGSLHSDEMPRRGKRYERSRQKSSLTSDTVGNKPRSIVKNYSQRNFNLINSLPRRCQTMINADESHIPY